METQGTAAIWNSFLLRWGTRGPRESPANPHRKPLSAAFVSVISFVWSPPATRYAPGGTRTTKSRAEQSKTDPCCDCNTTDTNQEAFQTISLFIHPSSFICKPTKTPKHVLHFSTLGCSSSWNQERDLNPSPLENDGLTFLNELRSAPQHWNPTLTRSLALVHACSYAQELFQGG